MLLPINSMSGSLGLGRAFRFWPVIFSMAMAQADVYSPAGAVNVSTILSAALSKPVTTPYAATRRLPRSPYHMM